MLAVFASQNIFAKDLAILCEEIDSRVILLETPIPSGNWMIRPFTMLSKRPGIPGESHELPIFPVIHQIAGIGLCEVDFRDRPSCDEGKRVSFR